MAPDIYLAFRFHGNFYHSFRGDTPDELGFGKDIRVIRHVVATLDEFNAKGIPVRGTWDFENCFSLETLMPAHCPDLIAALQRRAAAGDEIELMSYNNGLISGHTAAEFEAAIRRAVTNAAGSGLADLFGAACRPIVRPQEMMWTPSHLTLYRACGVAAISLYYAALPFNAFSAFIPPLPLVERYNPLTLAYDGIAETMTLLPCYSVGDLADHLTLRRWVRQMRAGQLTLERPADLLLLIDMDADDEFWVGYDVPLLRGRFATISGLAGLVASVADLPYLRFTTPGAYLDGHPPVGEVRFGQDTADGAFDGYSSWAEKWSNHALWTELEQARILDLHTRRLLDGQIPPDVQSLLDASFEARLKLLSTTHFGMAAPVLNVTREATGRNLAASAVQAARQAFDRAQTDAPEGASFSLLDYARGASTALLTYPAHPSTALIRLPRADAGPWALQDASGRPIPCAVLPAGAAAELLFVDSFAAGERKDYALTPGAGVVPAAPVRVEGRLLANERLRVNFDERGQLAGLQLDGAEFAWGRLLHSGVTYAGKHYEVTDWREVSSEALGVVGVKRLTGGCTLPGKGTLSGGQGVAYERDVLLAAGLPYLYVTTSVAYPRTPDHGFNKAKARRLEQGWDARWGEVWPCEIRPALVGGGTVGGGTPPLRVWKHNYCDHVSWFDLDYGRFSRNDVLDSVNNQVTHGWVAVSDGARGLLVAYAADVWAGMAFCPLRTRRDGAGLRVRLNPFGTYWGRQYDYPTADTGLGKLLVTAASASDHITSYAPSYNGQTQTFRLLIAPYRGDAPPDQVRWDAAAFAYPYVALTGRRP